jgi:hypothetical protein
MKRFIILSKVAVIILLLLVGFYVFDSNISPLIDEVNQLRNEKKSIEEVLKDFEEEDTLVWEEKFERAKQEIPMQYGVSQDEVEVLLGLESNGKRDAVKFEPHHMERVKKYTKNDGEKRMLSSSHGVWQIMGWHFAERKQHWFEAYDAEKSTHMAMTIWSECRTRMCKEGVSKYECLEKVAGCWNGSKEYARKFMVELSKRVINRMGVE